MAGMNKYHEDAPHGAFFPLQASAFAEIIQCRSVRLFKPAALIGRVNFDTRLISQAEDTAFFALIDRQDGHRFLLQAVRMGVRHLVIGNQAIFEECTTAAEFAECNLYFQPEGGLQALILLAMAARERFTGTVAVITGSNGKTLLKESMGPQLQGPVYRSPGSYNSTLGLAVSLIQLDYSARLAIMEAGISRPGDMDILREMARPEVVIFTMLGDAHDAGFANRREKMAEKLKLIGPGTRLALVGYWPEQAQYEDLLNTALSKVPTAVIINEPVSNTLSLKVKTGDKTAVRRVPLKGGGGHFPNLSALALISTSLLNTGQLPPEEGAQDLAAFRMKVDHRLRLYPALHQGLLIDDSYSLDRQSLELALKTCVEAEGHRGAYVVIMSDFDHFPGQEAEWYQSIAAILARYLGRHYKLIGIGPALSRQKAFFPEGALFYEEEKRPDLRTLEKFIPHKARILVKGAHKYALSELALLLRYQTHSATLRVDMKAMWENISVYRRQLPPECRLMVMVKAESYGVGLAQIGKLLANNKIEFLGVAYEDEAKELTRQGGKHTILIQNSEPTKRARAANHHIELYDFSQLEREAALATARHPQYVHVKLETGMHRLGFTEPELPALADRLLAAYPRLKVAGIMSHLSSADDGGEDDFTRLQIDRFRRMSSQLMAALSVLPEPPPLRHLLNSSGIAHFANEAAFDMARLGIGMYGIDPTGRLRGQLQECLQLSCRLNQVKWVEAGEGIGYGRHAIATRRMKIATLSIGYADGLPRAAGNGRATVLILGQPCPIVGNICMDMCMADVTEVPEAAEGMEALIFGPSHSITHLAAAAGTIPYEIMTGLSRRLRREYLY